ncbi:OmpA family protein [Aestuariirhabdus litorea]|uniref:OmpA-like domain-containing protein n=1 Tax=Aestuariirhabdus litorea TaxID=2528527 RepID=A0A3P3VPI1_9GAMM|nr:OmpA family protein [Aestuariirhabdus litorea]RRJ84510.1 hypothetical protein D0544_05230 [Aestuariirhabdus litorea]RWW97735.1 hypothetical protein DZC74_05225 [Endozoicomonadaceae bacterium GTF-13]
MKKTIALGSLLTTLSLPTTLMADSSTPEGVMGIGSGIVVGALVGGPFGAVIGAGLGHSLGEKVSEAAQLEQQQTLLGEANQRIAFLQRQLATTERQRQSLERANQNFAQRLQFEGLQLEVLFQTARAEIPEATRVRLNELARFLDANPEVSIRLDGYTDERGAEAYNHSLSLLRTNSVEDYLIEQGINPARIQSLAHGKELSTTAQGNPDLQALDRRVSISLSLPPQGEAVASRR